jgi:hypothetical protein
MNHILITTALQAEAQPLIEHYQLEKKQCSANIFYFQRGVITCLTTGVGEKNVRKRLGAFLNETVCRNTILMNMGIAGGNRDTTKIGKMYSINKITDEKNGKVWLPDALLKTGLPEMPLSSVSKGVTDGGNKYAGLVDMEGAAIFETVVQFIPVHCMVFLKIVSDHMDEILDSPEQVVSLINKRLPEIDRLISLMQNSGLVKTPLLNDQHEQLLNGLKKSLKLTATQTYQLKDKAEGFIAVQNDNIAFLSQYLKVEIKTKQERTKIFHEICTSLSA